MKKVIFFLLSIVAVATASAQSKRLQFLGDVNTRIGARDQLFIDSMLRLSKRLDTTVAANAKDTGIIFFNKTDKFIWYYDGQRMRGLTETMRFLDSCAALRSAIGLGGGGGSAPGGTDDDLQRKAGPSFAGGGPTWNNTLKTLKIPTVSVTGGITNDYLPPNVFSSGGRTSLNYQEGWYPFDNGNGTFNNVRKRGYNIDGFIPGQFGFFEAIEPWWVDGGVPRIEWHKQFYHPAGGGTHIRVQSETITPGATVTLTDAQEDFRTNKVFVSDWLSNSYWSVTKANGPNMPATMTLQGNNPVFQIANTNGGTPAQFQHTGAQVAFDYSLRLTGASDAYASQLVLQGGNSAGTRMIMEQASTGQYLYFIYTASTGANNNEYYMYDPFVPSGGKMPYRYRRATGATMINGDAQADEGSALQIYDLGGKGVYTNSLLRTNTFRANSTATFDVKAVYNSHPTFIPVTDNLALIDLKYFNDSAMQITNSPAPGNTILYNQSSVIYGRRLKNGTNITMTVDADSNITINSAAGSSYTFRYSLFESGGNVNLVNDVASPGNNKFYGTNGSGTRNWYDAFTTSGGVATFFPIYTGANAVTSSTLSAPAAGAWLDWTSYADPGSTSLLGGANAVITNNFATGVSGLIFNANSGGGQKSFIGFKNGTSRSSFNVATGQTGTLRFNDATDWISWDGTGIKLGLASAATGDMWYNNSSGYVTRRAIGAGYMDLKVQNGLPTWMPGLFTQYDSLTTVDATVTTINTVITPDGTSGEIHVRCNANTAAAANSNSYTYIIRYKNVGGTATVLSTQSVVSDVEDGGLTAAAVTATASGANILFRVQGVGSTTLKWNSFVQLFVNYSTGA